MFDDGFQEAIGFVCERISKLDLGDERPREIADAIMRLRSFLVSLKAAIVQTGLPIVRDALEHHKAKTGQFDYDDLITGVARALDGPCGDELVLAMRDRYRFALIDEFQDTDKLQWEFFRRVFIDSEGRNIAYLIADPKQAIYGFRGADVTTYIEARQEVEHAGTPRVPLIENFRSTPSMIEAYNHILDCIGEALPSLMAPFNTTRLSKAGGNTLRSMLIIRHQSRSICCGSNPGTARN